MIKNKKYHWNIKKFLSNMYFAVSVAFLLWMLASYLDVITHNLSGGTDAKWNLLLMMFK